MKPRKIIIGIVVVAILLILGGVLYMRGKNQEDADVIQAMYVPYGTDGYIMVDENNGTVFTVGIPDTILDINGKAITWSDLSAGNIVDIYGNGIMAESYPGQYPGVTKIQVVEEGSPSDANQYQPLIDQIYSEPDPSERPYLTGEYRTDLAIVAVTIPNGGYTWSYTGEEGETRTEQADSQAVLMWNKAALGDVAIAEDVDMTLGFSITPSQVTVSRWPEEYLGDSAYLDEHPEGEAVDVEETNGEWMIKPIQPGYVYRIAADWENGSVEYGFITALS